MDAKSEIKSILLDAIGSLSGGYKGSSLTDIFIYADEETGELSVYDDESNCISKGVVQSWVDISADEEYYTSQVRKVVKNMNHEKLFSSLDIYTPFSINMVDENFVVLEELLSIEDDSIIRLESNFMDRMDKEFDDFLDKLLKD